jgi:hypothetical protein
VACLGKTIDYLLLFSGEDNIMTAQPLPKIQELTDKINLFFSKKRRTSDFDIRLLKKEIDKLKGKIDYADYYDFLGQISSLENDKKGVVSYYEKALKLAPNNYKIQYNYASVPRICGLFFQAFTQVKDLYNKFQDITVLNLFIENAIQICRAREAQQLLETLENPTGFFAYRIIVTAVDIFENAGLSDGEAQHLYELAFSILEAKNLYYLTSSMNIIDDCVCYTIYVDSPIEDIFEINWELDKVFVENLDDTRSDILFFQYSSIKVLEEKESYERII